MDAYTPLVRRLAARVHARGFNTGLDFADLVQMGTVGLLEAIDRYTPAKGVRFETFATYRIEGAMLNGLASQSELQSQLAARREHERERARSLRDGAAASERSALDQFVDVVVGLALGFVLEDADAQTGEPSGPDNAYARTELAQLRRVMSELVAQLPPAERHVIFRHYFQQLPFEDIAQGLALSKGRVSQIHHAALERMRKQARRIFGRES